MPISTPSSPPFVITVGSSTFNHNTNNIVRSVVVEDHVDMASFCSLMFDASIDQGQVEAKIGDPVDVKLKTEDIRFSKEKLSLLITASAGRNHKDRALHRYSSFGRGRKTRLE